MVSLTGDRACWLNEGWTVVVSVAVKDFSVPSSDAFVMLPPVFSVAETGEDRNLGLICDPDLKTGSLCFLKLK